MVKLHYAILNAFTLGLDTGNPAAVIVLPTPSNPPSLDDRNSLWAAYPSDETLQKVATELGQPMTAFLLPLGVAGYYALRWFNVNMEAFLCGHATMALSYYLLEVVGDKVDQLVLETKHHGAISSTPIRADGRTKIVLNFPELRGFTTVNKVDEQYASIIRSLGVGAEDLEDLSISETYALLEFKPPVDLTSLTVDYDQLVGTQLACLICSGAADSSPCRNGLNDHKSSSPRLRPKPLLLRDHRQTSTQGYSAYRSAMSMKTQ